MTESPPTKSDKQAQPELSLQEQIDQLLTQIETQEPGTIENKHLPGSFRKQAAANLDALPPQPPAKPTAPDSATQASAQVDDVVAQAMQEVAAEQDPAPDETAEAAAAFEQALEPASEATATEPAEAAPQPDHLPAEQDLLASLNDALQQFNTPTKDQPEPQAAPPQAPTADAPAPAKRSGTEPSTEQQLQDEINALLNADPFTTPEPAAPQEQAAATEPEAEPQAQQDPEDQLASEIASLLDENQAPAKPGDPTIDDLDKMLADEIDADDELAGDFHSVDDVTAGIDTAAVENLQVDDTHAATASDVAAELDDQPEDNPPAEAPPANEDALSAILEVASIAQENEQKHRDELAGNTPGWRGRITRLRIRALRWCYALNWPARRYLTLEWRANLGYIALLNLFFGVAVWLYLIFL